MIKTLLWIALLLSSVWAKADFSEMSTEELVALIGYVDPTKEERFYQELDKRVQQMSEDQKTIYEADKQRREREQN
jgi:hypothetical protein